MFSCCIAVYILLHPLCVCVCVNLFIYVRVCVPLYLYLYDYSRCLLSFVCLYVSHHGSRYCEIKSPRGHWRRRDRPRPPPGPRAFAHLHSNEPGTQLAPTSAAFWLPRLFASLRGHITCEGFSFSCRLYAI